MVSRSVQTGTCLVKITAPGPTLAPSARRYSPYSAEPALNRATGLATSSVLTIQNRT